MLFYVEASCGADNMDWFVRAEHPRQAFEFWRSSDFVQTMDPMLSDVDGDVTVWLVPEAEGPSGPVDWEFDLSWTGLKPDDFALTMEEEG